MADAPAPPILELSLTRLSSIIARQRGYLYRGLVLMVMIVMAVTLVTPPTWTVVASFAPDSQKGAPSGLGGLAAQFGVALPMEGGESPDFYVAILESRPVLEHVLRMPVPLSPDGGRVLDVFVRNEPDTIEAIELGLRHLRKSIDSRISAETGIVELTVRTQDPALSLAIARELITRLEQFNIETRQTRASAERLFAEERLRQARRELNEAEAAVEVFAETNRSISESPRLSIQQQRLLRQVALRQQVVATLAEAFEKARIEEVRSTPVITLIAPPQVPGRADDRRMVLKIVLAMLAGLMLGVGYALVRELAASAHRTAEDVSLSEALRSDLAHPRRVGRWLLPWTSGVDESLVQNGRRH